MKKPIQMDGFYLLQNRKNAAYDSYIFFLLPIDMRKLSYIMSLRNGESRETDMNQSVSNSE